MKRNQKVAAAYDQSQQLSMQNKDYKRHVLNYLEGKLKNDIGKGDITTDTVIHLKQAKALIKAKQDGIIAGLEEVLFFYDSHSIKATRLCEDGDYVRRGSTILQLEGATHNLLRTERTALNLIQMMSGIATNTREYVDILKPYDTIIAATRKEWSDECIEKKAITVGGGYTHRLGLDGFILIKDNHLEAIRQENVDPITTALERVYTSKYKGAIEIEVETKEQAEKAALYFLQKGGFQGENTPIIMLDNMMPEKVKTLVPKLRGSALLEVSGNVDLSTLKEYAETGVDVISTSKLSRGAPAFDLSQSLEEK